MNKILHSLHKLDISVGNLGTTIRNGLKWHGIGIGEELDLCVCSKTGHKIEGTGEVVNTSTCVFKDIPARLIENEHEESSRLYSGLLASMRRAYGKDFSEDSLVTVLTYLRTN